jgi:ABC-type microcin C transport system permease subunit YejB
VLVEKVFAWPGIGSYAVEALVASDYAAVQGFVLAMALLFVVLNLVIDLPTLIDPRIGFGKMTDLTGLQPGRMINGLDQHLSTCCARTR